MGGAQRHHHPHQGHMGGHAGRAHRSDGGPDRLRQPRYRGCGPRRGAGPGHPPQGVHGGAGRDEIPAHHDHDQQHPAPQRRRCGRGQRGGRSLPRPEGFHVRQRLHRPHRQAGRAKSGKGPHGVVRVLPDPHRPDVQLLLAAGLSGGQGPGRDRLHQRHERRVRHAPV